MVFFRVDEIAFFALRMCPFMLTICLFMSLSEKMTSFGKVTPLILQGLGSRRAQFPVTEGLSQSYSQSYSSYPLVRRIVKSKSASISTLVRACLFLLLEMNSRSTSSPLLTTFRSTARIA